MDKQYCGHDVTEDEEATIKTMLQDAEGIKIMPNHCINIHNEFEGFRLAINHNTKGSALCVNRSMFFGHSLFECISDDYIINKDVVRLMSRDNVPDMKELIQTYKHKENATFDCIPDNTDSMQMSEDLVSSYVVSYATGKRSVDSLSWRPDVPVSMGLYHAMVRGYQKDVRQHRMFIAVSGGLNKCCDMFYNLMMDVGDQWTAKEVVDSEEVWWLRKACQRARCMVASDIAAKFGLRIYEALDVHSFYPRKIGVPTVDTIENNLLIDESNVYLTNRCCEVTNHQNGILVRMNPVEGYWLFRGNTKSSTKITNFGLLHMWKYGAFPTNSPYYRVGMGSPCYVAGKDNRLVVRDTPIAEGGVYQCFDEHYMRNLETMGWNRDHGVVELMPVVVACA